MHPTVRLLRPRIEPVLEVEMVREHPPRLEVRAHEPVRALQRALRLRIPRLEDHPPELQLAAERRERLRRPAARGDRRLAIPHQLLRQRPQPRQVPGQAPEDVRRLLAEHQRARDRARPAHLAGHHPPATPLPMPDRDMLPRLPQIALHQLARPIDRPLKRPGRPRTAAGPRGHSRRRSTSRPHSRSRRPSRATAATGSADPPQAAHRSSP